MQRFNGQLINQFPNTINGNAAAGAQVTIRVKSSGALASLYATNSLSGGTLPNPITADAKGYYGFYAPDNVYTLDVNIAGTPQLEIQLQDIVNLVDFVDSAVAQVQNSGTEPTGQTITFAIVGEDNSRTWLEMTSEGKPTEYAQQLINEGVDTITDIPLPDLNNQAFAITGEDGSRTWLEADEEGKPTDYSTAKIIEKLPAIPSLETIPQPELNMQGFVIVGEDSSESWLQADQSGKPTEYAIKCIQDKMPFGGDANYYVDSTGKKIRVSSGPNIVAYGDSMTAGATGIPYTDYLLTMLANDGKTNQIYNLGVGGESSVTIAARANGTPFTALVTGGVIPSSGRIGIKLLPINGVTPEPIRQSGSWSCVMAGIAGTFGADNSGGVYSYWFERAQSGVSVTSNRPETIYISAGNERREDIAIIWIGQNTPAWVDGNTGNSTRNNDRAILDAKSIISYLSAVDKRFIVISKPSGTNANNAEDAKWFDEFNQRFIPIRQYITTPIYAGDNTTIINCYGLQDAGITPTSQDLTEIAQGQIPSSFRNDAVHWKAAGYEVLAKVIYKKLNELGWV